MNIVGADVAKDSIVCVRIDRSEKVKETYTVANTSEKIEEFIDLLSHRYKHLLVASEATAEYHLNLVRTCLKKNIPFRLLNPITTKQFTRSTVRKKKTDLTDAHIIARLALRGEGTVVGILSLGHTKPTVRTATKLAQVKQQLYLMEKRLKALNFDQDLIEKLDDCVLNLDQTVKAFRNKARKDSDPKTLKLLESIPGIGKTLSCDIQSEIETLGKFKDTDALIAFAGLDPKVKQSGTGLHHNTKLTKRGSPYLRRALFMAASIGQRNNSELKAYYDKKRAEGKYYKEATVANARKIVCRVFAVLKRQTPYIIN